MFEYLNELHFAAEKLYQSYGVIVTVTLFLRCTGSFAAVLLMILDGTKWKSTNILTSLLAPYLFVSLPLVIFQFLRGEFGKWIALLAVVFRLFLPNQFPGSLKVPNATLLLIVAPPDFFMETFRDDLRMRDPVQLCFLTSGYLINKHTKDCDGYKNALLKRTRLHIPFVYIFSLSILFGPFSSCKNPTQPLN